MAVILRQCVGVVSDEFGPGGTKLVGGCVFAKVIHLQEVNMYANKLVPNPLSITDLA